MWRVGLTYITQKGRKLYRSYRGLKVGDAFSGPCNRTMERGNHATPLILLSFSCDCHNLSYIPSWLSAPQDNRNKNVEDILILSGDHLYRMDYMDFVQVG